MIDYILPLQKLIEQFGKLPGVGRKTATRLALSVLDLTDDSAEEFARAILSAKREIKKCRICGNISVGEQCEICSDDERDHSLVCVVEDAKAVMAFEKVREYNGVYHVLDGVLSPINGIGPEDINLYSLLKRIQESDIAELIIATNPTVEGEATAMYISRLVSDLGVKASRLAYGVPVGGDLEYADEVTLHRALEGRREIN